MDAGYSAAPLVRRLGAKPHDRVLVDGGPDALILDGLRWHRRPGPGPYQLILLFCPDRDRLTRRWDPLARRLTPAGRLWVCWRKRSSGVQTDLGESDVRGFGLAKGLVDVKICAIDSTWSGLAFVRRLADR